MTTQEQRRAKRYKRFMIRRYVTIFIMATIISFGLVKLTYAENHYSIKATVKSINNRVTLLQDTSYNDWYVIDDNYTKGEQVKIYFYDNLTFDREDDIILKVKR